MGERSPSRAGIGTARGNELQAGVAPTSVRTALAVLALLSPGVAVTLLYGPGSGPGSPPSCQPYPAAPSPAPFALRPDRMGTGRDAPAAGSANNVATGTPSTPAKASSVETVTFPDPRSTRPTYDRSMLLASASPSWLRPRSTRRRRRFLPRGDRLGLAGAQAFAQSYLSQQVDTILANRQRFMVAGVANGLVGFFELGSYGRASGQSASDCERLS